MHERQKVTAIPLFHNNVNKEKLTEYNSAVEANTSSEAGTSSEERISLSFQRWNIFIITRGIVLYYSVFLFFLFPTAPWNQSVRGWPARPAKFLSDRGTTGQFNLLPSVFPIWQSADALQNDVYFCCCNKCLCPVRTSSVCSAVPLVQVVTVKLLTGSWHARIEDTKNLDL